MRKLLITLIAASALTHTASAGQVGRSIDFTLWTPVPCGLACGDDFKAPYGRCGSAFVPGSVDELTVRAPKGASQIHVRWWFWPDAENVVDVRVCPASDHTTPARPLELGKASAGCTPGPPHCLGESHLVASVVPGVEYRIWGLNRLEVTGDINGFYVFTT